MTILYANPYDTEATGFYFTSYEQYELLLSDQINLYGQPVEEFEIEHVEGADDFAALCSPDQPTIEEWFESLDTFENLDDDDKVKLHYLMAINGVELEQAMDMVDDVMLYEGNTTDAAYDHVNDCYDLDETRGQLAQYFDYQRFAVDCVLGGDWCEFMYNNSVYVVLNANQV